MATQVLATLTHKGEDYGLIVLKAENQLGVEVQVPLGVANWLEDIGAFDETE